MFVGHVVRLPGNVGLAGRRHHQAPAVGEEHEALTPVREPRHRLVERRLADGRHEHAGLPADRITHAVDVDEVVVRPQLLLLLKELESRAVHHRVALRLEDALRVLLVEPALQVAREARPERCILEGRALEELRRRRDRIAGTVRGEFDLLDRIEAVGRPRGVHVPGDVRKLHDGLVGADRDEVPDHDQPLEGEVGGDEHEDDHQRPPQDAPARFGLRRLRAVQGAEEHDGGYGHAEHHEGRDADVAQVREETGHVDILRASLDARG